MEGFGSNKEVVLCDLEKQVQRNLQLLDANISEEYHEALATVPDLVEKESPVINFLRTEDYHTLRTANRIAMYWKTRKEIFGERWLLPMTQTGAGASTNHQVEMLRSGFLVLTSSPQPVFITDATRLPKGVNYCDPAIVFYLNSLACETSQTEGYTLFHVIQSNISPSFQRIAPQMGKKLVSCAPLKIKNVVLGRPFDPGHEHFMEYRVYQQIQATERNFGKHGEYVIGNSVRDTLNAFEERGLDRRVIPLALGGDYFYSSQFNDWIRTRLSIEGGAMVAAPPVRNTCTANAVLSFRAGAGKDNIADTGVWTRATQATAQKYQASVTSPSLGTQPRGDEEQKGEEEDHGTVRHQGLLLHCSGVLVKQKPGESREAFEKRRHLVYGKRSYHKKQRNLDDLKNRKELLERTKAVLLTENKRLEAILEQAELLLPKDPQNDVITTATPQPKNTSLQLGTEFLDE